MDKVYVDTVGLPIYLDTTITLTGALLLAIKVRKPSGSEVTWVGSLSGTKEIVYTTVSGDLDEPGVYDLQAYVQLATGLTSPGATVTLKVYPRFK